MTHPVTIWSGPNGKRVSILTRDDKVAVMQVNDCDATCQTVMLPIESLGAVTRALEAIDRARTVVAAFQPAIGVQL